MKRIFLVLTLAITMLLVAGSGYAQTKVLADLTPPIDFKDVANWETLKVNGPNIMGNAFELKRNPDPTHIVKYVLVRRWRAFNWGITGYAYYEGEKLFVYELDRPGPEGKFILRTEPLDPEEKDHVYEMLHPGTKMKPLVGQEI